MQLLRQISRIPRLHAVKTRIIPIKAVKEAQQIRTTQELIPIRQIQEQAAIRLAR